jgi:hypothetical protein
MVENQGDRTMIPLKAYLEKKAADYDYSDKNIEGQLVSSGATAGLGAIGGATLGPDLANTIKPGMLAPGKARIIAGLLGAAGGAVGGHQLWKAFQKADKKDKRSGIKPVDLTKHPIPAKGKLGGQIFSAEIGGGLGGVGAGLGAKALIEGLRPETLPHNVNRASLIAGLLGAGGAGYGAYKLYGSAADKHNADLKKKK